MHSNPQYKALVRGSEEISYIYCKTNFEDSNTEIEDDTIINKQ